MRIEHEIDLSKYTTVKIGGIAENFYIPENVEELISLLRAPEMLIIGGGSNLLINDRKRFANVILLREFSKEITMLDQGHCYVGASVRNQKLISWLIEHNMGGIEYLSSVPGLVGGAIYMNAGRGTSSDSCIGKYIVSVDAYVDGKLRSFDCDECEFGHRESVFQKNGGVILGATFLFPKQASEIGKEKVKERLEYCKEKQDHSGTNFGSVFRKFNGTILKIICKMGIKKGSIVFSKRTNNWLMNMGDGKYADAKWLINMIIKIHKLLNKEVSLEVKLWD